MKIALVGYGKTGQKAKNAVDDAEGMECVGVVSSKYLKDLSELNQRPDVIIDFSHPSNLEMIGRYVEGNPAALVLGTTGYGPEHMETINALAEKVPVVYTANFSLGVTVFQQILKQITPVLRNAFDIEMVEKHHRRKLDAPSGTAKMLRAATGEDNMPIHSMRAGSIAGEHTVIFAGEDEILEITHRADSNRIFANGAVLAAQFAAGREPGLYDMNDVLFHEEQQENKT
jgi:4-hydroxy-tetrahydrodipicolinate reductase